MLTNHPQTLRMASDLSADSPSKFSFTKVLTHLIHCLWGVVYETYTVVAHGRQLEQLCLSRFIN